MADTITDYQGNRIDVGGSVTIQRQLLSGTQIAKINGIQIFAPTPSGGGGGGGTTQDIKIQIPDKVFAVVGTELNIWNDAVTLSIDRGLQSPLNYYVEWNCAKGKVFNRCFRIKPVATDVGTYNCTCTIYDMNGVQLDSKIFQLIILPNTNSLPKNILFVGDSTGTGTYQGIVADFNDANRFSGATKPQIHDESTGGWHWGLYSGEGVVYQRVQVSGIGSLNVGAQYVDGQNNLFDIKEVNITEGSGNVLIGKVYRPPYGYNPLTIPSGALTKVSGNGDSTFSYNNGVNEAGNPFWNTAENKLDIAFYRNNKGISDKFDMVIFQLGINSNNVINTDGEMERQILSLYSAFMIDNPNCLFVLGCTPQSTNDHSAAGANYGANKGWGLEYAKNEYKIRDLYFSLADNEEYPNIKVIGENLCIDRWYGYPTAERDISDRVSEDETVHTNYVHPASSGYAQLGDAVFASIIGLFNN